jgi:FkbM family methyltransferase
VWPWRVLSGPAKGVRLVLDIRFQGAYWLGNYDQWILNRLHITHWLPKGGVAWDCGTYAGYYAAIFRKTVGDNGKVVAFEASRSNYERAKAVPALNGWTNLEVVHKAVGPDHSTIRFAGNLEGSSGPVGLTKEFGDRLLEVETVDCAGVDELAYELGLPEPDFIKFDLETAEEKALHNGERLFSTKRPVLLLELHGESVHPSVCRFLEKYDYSAWDILKFEDKSVPPLDARTPLNAAIVSNTLVCLPSERARERIEGMDKSGVRSDVKADKEIRVLAIIGSSHLFGHERANFEVLRCLAESGAKVKVVINRRVGLERVQPELERLGLESVPAPFGFPWGKYLLGWRFFYGFANVYGVLVTSFIVWRESKSWNATHLYAGCFPHVHYALLALKASRQPLIFRAGDEWNSRPIVWRLIVKPILRRATQIVCNCEFLRNKFISVRPLEAKVRVIYNHPPLRESTPAEEGVIPAVPDNAVVILFVGQPTKNKGVDLIVEAVAREITEERANVVLWVVGESWGGLRQELEEEVCKKGLEARIRFLGYRGDIPKLLSRTDVHVCPSVWQEPSPNVIFEAKQAGVPSVAFNAGGIPELIRHKVDGFICAEKTVNSLRDGMRYFLASKETRETAGLAARQSIAERFGYERFKEQWLTVFNETRNKTER